MTRARKRFESGSIARRKNGQQRGVVPGTPPLRKRSAPLAALAACGSNPEYVRESPSTNTSRFGSLRNALNCAIAASKLPVLDDGSRTRR
jgi:hypothetical protein